MSQHNLLGDYIREVCSNIIMLRAETYQFLQFPKQIEEILTTEKYSQGYKTSRFSQLLKPMISSSSIKSKGEGNSRRVSTLENSKEFSNSSISGQAQEVIFDNAFEYLRILWSTHEYYPVQVAGFEDPVLTLNSIGLISVDTHNFRYNIKDLIAIDRLLIQIIQEGEMGILLPKFPGHGLKGGGMGIEQGDERIELHNTHFARRVKEYMEHILNDTELYCEAISQFIIQEDNVYIYIYILYIVT